MVSWLKTRALDLESDLECFSINYYVIIVSFGFTTIVVANEGLE